MFEVGHSAGPVDQPGDLVFGTLTFKTERLSERKRYHTWFALLRRAARHFRKDFGQMLWTLRAENGERTGRAHFHFLLAGLEARAACPTTCFFLMDLWEKLGGGMARVSVFDPRLNAGAYILKDLHPFDASSLAGGFHESGKFSWGDCTLTIANSVWNAARNQMEQNRR
jgi:hypothetical protein